MQLRNDNIKLTGNTTIIEGNDINGVLYSATTIGQNAGRILTTGVGNLFIGYQAGHSATTGNNNINIGANSTTTANTTNNTLVFGSSSITVNNAKGYNNALMLGSLNAPLSATTNVGAAGASQALPKTGTTVGIPHFYLTIVLNGDEVKIPIFG